MRRSVSFTMRFGRAILACDGGTLLERSQVGLDGGGVERFGDPARATGAAKGGCSGPEVERREGGHGSRGVMRTGVKFAATTRVQK